MELITADDVITLSQLLNQQFKAPVKTYKLEGASIREIGDIDYVIADGVGAIVTVSELLLPINFIR